MMYVCEPLEGAKCQTISVWPEDCLTPNVSGVRFDFLSGDPFPVYRVELPRMSSEETVTRSIDSPGRRGMSR